MCLPIPPRDDRHNLRLLKELIQLNIRKDDLTGVEIADFLREHVRNMREISPPESSHALDLSGLRSPDVTFWSVWEGASLVGCGALKELDVKSGEVKSMRTATTQRGKGVGSRMLEYILEEAKRRDYARLYLETGAQPEFAPARALYERYDFAYRGPFASYLEDPNSVFMVKTL